MADQDFEMQMKGFSLTTAEILYYMPDHPRLLQSYLWQEYDLAPRFPRLQEFLKFWTEHLDGTLSHVRVANQVLLKPREFRLVKGEFMLS